MNEVINEKTINVNTFNALNLDTFIRDLQKLYTDSIIQLNLSEGVEAHKKIFMSLKQDYNIKSTSCVIKIKTSLSYFYPQKIEVITHDGSQKLKGDGSGIENVSTADLEPHTYLKPLTSEMFDILEKGSIENFILKEEYTNFKKIKLITTTSHDVNVDTQVITIDVEDLKFTDYTGESKGGDGYKRLLLPNGGYITIFSDKKTIKTTGLAIYGVLVRFEVKGER